MTQDDNLRERLVKELEKARIIALDNHSESFFDRAHFRNRYYLKMAKVLLPFIQSECNQAQLDEVKRMYDHHKSLEPVSAEDYERRIKQLEEFR